MTDKTDLNSESQSEDSIERNAEHPENLASKNPSTLAPMSPLNYTPSSFSGNGSELFKIGATNLLFTLLTLGVYWFWARVEMLRYVLSHLKLSDEYFNYHATGLEKFKGFVKGLILLSPLFLIPWAFSFFMPESKMLIQTIQQVAVFFAILFLQPVISYGRWRFEASRISWNNVRFRYNGSLKEFYKVYFKNFFYLIISFGIYGPWFFTETLTYHIEHISLGGKRFKFHLNGGDVFKVYLKTMGIYLLGAIAAAIAMKIHVALAITIGVAVFLFLQVYPSVSMFNLLVFNTTLEDSLIRGRLKLPLGMQIYGAFLISLLTLGLALPWVLSWALNQVANSVEVYTAVTFKEMISNPDYQASAELEALGDAASALDGIGDLF